MVIYSTYGRERHRCNDLLCIYAKEFFLWNQNTQKLLQSAHEIRTLWKLFQKKEYEHEHEGLYEEEEKDDEEEEDMQTID